MNAKQTDHYLVVVYVQTIVVSFIQWNWRAQTMNRLKSNFMFLEFEAQKISDSNYKSDCIVLLESESSSEWLTVNVSRQKIEYENTNFREVTFQLWTLHRIEVIVVFERES